MIQAETSVETEAASRYIAQLCKHFLHKVPAEWDDNSGRADFPFGVCHMRAENGRLTMSCEAPDDTAMARLKFVITDHLERFAWKEKIRVTWETPA